MQTYFILQKTTFMDIRIGNHMYLTLDKKVALCVFLSPKTLCTHKCDKLAPQVCELFIVPEHFSSFA